MPAEKPSQSFSVSGSELQNVQIGGQASGDLTANQIQQINQNATEPPLTQVEVVNLILQLESLFRAELAPEQAEKAIKHLEVAKEEAKSDSPDQEYAAKSLQRATKVLKDAGETVEAGTSLWKKVQPILQSLVPWLGVAAGFFA